MRHLKSELSSGKVAIGLAIGLPWIEAVEMAGNAGFDFILIDTEHGAIDVSDAEVMILAAHGAGLSPIWRVSGVERSEIKRALDWGAEGVFVPEIKSAQDVAQVVEAAKYPPLGKRGVGPQRPIRYGLDSPEAYMQRANEQTLICLNIELAEAIDQIEEIVEVEGIDVLNIGPYDLSTSLGVPLQLEHPRMLDAIERVLSAALPRGLVVGLSGSTPEHLRQWLPRGVTFYESAGLPDMLAAAMEQHVAQLQAAVNPQCQ